jgi:Lamin Tail Domain
MNMNLKPALLVLAMGAGAMGSANAAIVITEVDSAASGNSGYGFDWFELTNTGASAVNISGWKMDDSSASAGSAAVLNGVTSIAAGQAVIFSEGGSMSAFVNNWFGGTAPAGFQFGTYSGSGLGLSTGGDAVYIFNATNGVVANVSFGTANENASFANPAGANNVTLTSYSLTGVNGAYAGLDGRVGSPGSVSAVPLPAAVWLLGSGLGLLGAARRRRAPV